MTIAEIKAYLHPFDLHTLFKLRDSLQTVLQISPVQYTVETSLLTYNVVVCDVIREKADAGT